MKSETITELAAALSKAQGEMPAAEMNATNPFLKNKYADLGSIIQAARPVMKKYGLSITQLPTSNNGDIGVTTILMHESGEYIEETIYLPLGEEKGKSLAQVAGSVITYLRRYSYASILGMYADQDIDGSHPQAKPAKPKEDANAVYQAIVDMNLAENIHAARNALAKRDTSKVKTKEQAISWMKVYRGARDAGASVDEAAEQANSLPVSE